MSKKNRYLRLYYNNERYRTTGADSSDFRNILMSFGVIDGYEKGYIEKYILLEIIARYRGHCVTVCDDKDLNRFFPIGNDTELAISRPKIRIDVIRNSDIALNYKMRATSATCHDAPICPCRSKFVEKSYFPKVNYLTLTDKDNFSYIFTDKFLDNARSKGHLNIVSKDEMERHRSFVNKYRK